MKQNKHLLRGVLWYLGDRRVLAHSNWLVDERLGKKSVSYGRCCHFKVNGKLAAPEPWPSCWMTSHELRVDPARPPRITPLSPIPLSFSPSLTPLFVPSLRHPCTLFVGCSRSLNYLMLNRGNWYAFANLLMNKLTAFIMVWSDFCWLLYIFFVVSFFQRSRDLFGKFAFPLLWHLNKWMVFAKSSSLSPTFAFHVFLSFFTPSSLILSPLPEMFVQKFRRV